MEVCSIAHEMLVALEQGNPKIGVVEKVLQCFMTAVERMV
jgi:hypothetical protein